jgi:hypothetical protein
MIVAKHILDCQPKARAAGVRAGQQFLKQCAGYAKWWKIGGVRRDKPFGMYDGGTG